MRGLRIVNLPQTNTLIALGFLACVIGTIPMLAWLGPLVPEKFTEHVGVMIGLVKDGMLFILGFYFAKNQAETAQRHVQEVLKETTSGTSDPAAGASVGAAPRDGGADASEPTDDSLPDDLPAPDRLGRQGQP